MTRQILILMATAAVYSTNLSLATQFTEENPDKCIKIQGITATTLTNHSSSLINNATISQPHPAVNEERPIFYFNFPLIESLYLYPGMPQNESTHEITKGTF